MLSLYDNNQAAIVEAFNSTSSYLDDLLNTDNPYFAQMVSQIHTTEHQLNKANHSDIQAPFLDLDLFITNGIVSTKLYDNFEVNLPLILLMEMFLAPVMVYKFCNVFVLQEYVPKLMTSTIETHFDF